MLRGGGPLSLPVPSVPAYAAPAAGSPLPAPRNLRGGSGRCKLDAVPFVHRI